MQLDLTVAGVKVSAAIEIPVESPFRTLVNYFYAEYERLTDIDSSDILLWRWADLLILYLKMLEDYSKRGIDMPDIMRVQDEDFELIASVLSLELKRPSPWVYNIKRVLEILNAAHFVPSSVDKKVDAACQWLLNTKFESYQQAEVELALKVARQINSIPF